jgi:DNA uptake protein ComE-like DNA-binding protein
MERGVNAVGKHFSAILRWRAIGAMRVAWSMCISVFVVSAAWAATAPETTAPQPPPGHPVAPPAKPTQAKQAKPVKLIDINKASRAELKTLPGVGDAEATKIIAGRPWLTKADLVTKNVLPEGIYVSIRDKIVAGQAGKPPQKK